MGLRQVLCEGPGGVHWSLSWRDEGFYQSHHAGTKEVECARAAGAVVLRFLCVCCDFGDSFTVRGGGMEGGEGELCRIVLSCFCDRFVLGWASAARHHGAIAVVICVGDGGSCAVRRSVRWRNPGLKSGLKDIVCNN